jgi:hypothetical protein
LFKKQPNCLRGRWEFGGHLTKFNQQSQAGAGSGSASASREFVQYLQAGILSLYDKDFQDLQKKVRPYAISQQANKPRLIPPSLKRILNDYMAV